MDFNKSKTKQNLAKAFAAECQAGARYQFIATLAQQEMLTYIKDTMKMLAKNEMAHAKLFYDYIADDCDTVCKVKIDADYPYVKNDLSTALKEASAIEKEEFDTIYPEFAEIAKNEGFSDIAKSFELVASVEQTHAKILKYLYENYSAKTLYKHKIKMILKCSNCGHLDYLSEGWKKCPLCNFEQGAITIDFSKQLEESLGLKKKNC